MLIKGILDPEDAKDAVRFGADSIIVSNHGGRQLDGVLSSARACHIAEMVRDRSRFWPIRNPQRAGYRASAGPGRRLHDDRPRLCWRAAETGVTHLLICSRRKCAWP
jgi:hypothetical protein